MQARWRGSHLKCKLWQVQGRGRRGGVLVWTQHWTVFTFPGYTAAWRSGKLGSGLGDILNTAVPSIML